MSITLTAQPLPAAGAIKLRITADAPITQITAKPAGAAEYHVRTLAGALPATPPLIISDYEAPLNIPVTYEIKTGSEIAKVTAQLDSPYFALLLPQNPHVSARPSAIKSYTETAKTAAGVDWVIGRADPLATLIPGTARQGAISYWEPTREAAVKIGALYRSGFPLLLRFPATAQADLYHVATQVTVTPVWPVLGVETWEVEVQYVEQARPGGPLLAVIGWDYATLAAKVASYEAVAAQFASYEALMEGPLNA